MIRLVCRNIHKTRQRAKNRVTGEIEMQTAWVLHLALCPPCLILAWSLRPEMIGDGRSG